ncbi:pentapeptide repeat-containing protein [Rothia sp. 110740021-2]
MPSTSSAPESPVIPKAQEKPWYIQHFTKLLIGFGLGGGAVALVLPWMLWSHCGMSSGSSDQLRLHLLYVTGGVIAVLTLLQTNWKNQGDRLKIDADIKKNEQDAEKNQRDHIRQVHAERRSRYTKAVEQLADEKATVRLGGIYTLVGLVDEWLTDGTLIPEERQKEGQVIINNLCSYIRSPFTLALKAEMFEGDSEPDNYEGDFSKDQAVFREEQDVRRTIFDEMSKRSSTFTRDRIGKIIDTSLGTWSDFEFNFSRAPIFYPLNAITIEKGNFSGARFYAGANFVEATFTSNADFRAATFICYADFFMATFTSNADFSAATFTSNANFVAATFTRIASFSKATFTRRVIFYSTTFTQYGPLFTMAGSEEYKAQFSAGAGPRDYDFSVSSESKPIKCETATLLGKSFTIPIGTILFDPDSWDEEKQDYTRISEPAQ